MRAGTGPKQSFLDLVKEKILILDLVKEWDSAEDKPGHIQQPRGEVQGEQAASYS